MKIDLSKKEFQIKKKHHYVWGHYLNQWSVGKGVYYISESGKIACDSAKGLSWEKGFYKVHALTQEDIDFISAFSKKSPIDNLRKIHMQSLGKFIEISRRLHLAKALNIESPELEHITQVLTYNALEDTHSIVESLALPVLQNLWDERPEILQNSTSQTSFHAFIGHQITRTKSLKKMAFSFFDDDEFYVEEFPNYNFLFERNWWFLSYLWGINLGHSFIFGKNLKCIFIKNNTKIPFITSDNPAINVHPSLKYPPQGKGPENLDLYYPLSPKLAYMINESDYYNYLEHSISEEDVSKLNKMMVLKADKTIFSDSDQILKQLRNLKST